ncbi:hypothetical protein [Flavobacterium sp. N2820]|uniref:hypothetical protein n=1 Tax=Flavobacterium sp. N2820 TaxID=2986834 RepID=UPI0022247BB6|nr:hypothetical protein [Flavobacterium sp. N2820]
MIQFLENSKPIFTSDREDLIDFYTSKGYEVCPILYNGSFLSPIWNGTAFVEGATPEEIAEANNPIVPQTISAMRLKLQLFDMGITDEDIFEDIDSIPEFMFSITDKEKAKIKYKTATSFERTNGELNFVATMEGLTQQQVDEIFINGNL